MPAEKGKYGRAYVGFDRYGTEGGVNDQGLLYDGASAPQLQAHFLLFHFPFPGNLLDKVLAECATVEQALQLIGKYNNVVNDKGQLLLGDKSGNSAIAGCDKVVQHFVFGAEPM